MPIKSREYAKIVDIYFTGVLFKNPDTADINTVPNVEKYCKQEEGDWVLDIQRMSKEEPFKCLFPPDAKDLNEQDWKSVNQRIYKEHPSGGILRPFFEKEDDIFLGNCNRDTGGSFARSNEFSIPEEFGAALQSLRIYAVYDSDENTFKWDFSDMIKYKPVSVYDAYRRYAHARYTILFIGSQTAPNEKQQADKLIEKGHDKLLDELIEPKIRKLRDKEFLDGPGSLQRVANKLKMSIDWDFAEYALQGFPGGDPYTLGKLDVIVIHVFSRIRRYKKMRVKEGEKPLFDHNDEVNINNAMNSIIPLLSKEERIDLESSSIIARVKELFRIITNPDMKNKVDIKRVNTIERLYIKWLISESDDLDAPNTDKDGEESGTLGDTVAATGNALPDELLIEKDDRERLVKLFNEQFAGSKNFLLKIDESIHKESLNWIGEEIGRYGRQGGHNTDSWLWKTYRDAGGTDITHTIFTEKIRSIIAQL
ncbi:hypothetical protein FACS1894200_00050 [Spirochaetia bacterium]|nr:hypothetical protein FACS1894200_00050 [Spirochaetia bacterium]